MDEPDQPVILPLGSEALTWVRKGGRPDRGGSAHQLMASWQSFWFERNLSLQRRLQVLALPPMDPIFILGLWRSGTTLLHDLLSAVSGMIYPTTWQCMNASSLRLRGAPARSRSTARPMDRLSVDAYSPQEDEFALLALGVPSVYRGFLDPRRLNELTCWLDPDSWSTQRPDGWLTQWCEFLAGVANQRRGRLLLKSPGHTFRVKALTSAFPNATYIWIVRDPADVYFSNRKMWISMFRRYALWNWRVQELELFLQRAFEAGARCLDLAIHSLPAARLGVVSFGELTKNPFATINAITDKLGIRLSPGDDSAIAKVALARAGDQADTYKVEGLTAECEVALNRMREVQEIALSTHAVA